MGGNISNWITLTEASVLTNTLLTTNGTGSGLTAVWHKGDVVTNAVMDNVLTNNYPLPVTMASNLTVVGTLSSTYIDPSHTVYDLAPIVVGSTVIVTRAQGSHLGINMASNTTFVIDWSTFPTNQYASFSLCINPMSFSPSWGEGLTNTLSLTASNWHTIIFTKGCYWSKFLGVGKVAP